MNKVGNREVIYNNAFIVPFNESFSFNLTVGGTDIPVTVHVKEEEREDKSSAQWDMSEGKLSITYYGFKPTIGARIMQTPTKIGTVGDQSLTFLSATERHHSAFLFHMQVMLGRNDNHE